MILHRFSEEGVNRFGQFLDALSANGALAVPTDLLTDTFCSVPVPPGPDVQARTFISRMEAARYLDSVLSGVTGCDVERDVGLWAWLSLFYFEELCSPDGRGHRKPGERARWIPAVDEARRSYRHLLAGAYRVYRAHRDNPEGAMVLLHTPLSRTGHFWYQLASRQELVTNPAIMEAAAELYLGQCGTNAKPGATGEGLGGVFRFAAIFNQFDKVWDLYAMNKQQILDLLPGEFDRYREGSPLV